MSVLNHHLLRKKFTEKDAFVQKTLTFNFFIKIAFPVGKSIFHFPEKKLVPQFTPTNNMCYQKNSNVTILLMAQALGTSLTL